MSLLAYDRAPRGPNGGALRVDHLDESDRDDLITLIERDPLVNAVADARIRTSSTLNRGEFVGTLLGVRGEDAVLRAAVLDTGNLIPIGGGPAEWSALAQHVGAQARRCSSIVGRADAITVMWPVLQARWGAARAVRPAQPLLVLDRTRLQPAPESGLRAMRMADLERYLPAAAAMFTEELGIVPGATTSDSQYRRRVSALITAGRAFGVIECDEVIFKADLCTVSPHTCQVQGVWVRPDLRGRGLATAAMAAVLHQALAMAPTASLYVNDFNVPARRLYARLGMREAAVLSTVLF